MALTANQIKYYREAFGITQGQLAKRIGITPVMLGFIERGERTLSQSVAVRAGMALLEVSRQVTTATAEIQSLANTLQK
ncbi:helix-turn-helix transcriptional regulator [Lysinibacillus capsici]|uniref:helix-turn-helix transcriptional regulator n=1 Tax=Lysinibacillus capsici TaxID=2115968 RepID=UPI0028BED423|nr:helix-turn-helix transcriptional regulator [Lysinibacillus capsici]WNN75138.1 helix-turn-helix transcriptional regulator [Lysinibacillus capsici]